MFDQSELKLIKEQFDAFRTSQSRSKPQPKKKGGRGGTLTSLISEGGTGGGAAAGALIGSAVPIVGTAIGGILGAGIGAFGGRLAENKIRDDRLGVGDAAKEAALSSILAGPLRLGKYATTAVKSGRKGAGLEDALVEAAKASSGPGLLKKGASKVGEKAAQRSANRFLEVTPSSMQRLLDEGVDPQQLMAKWGKQLGTSYDEMLKNTHRLIKQAEDSVTSTAKVTGKNIRIDGSDIIKRLQNEAKKIRGELGGTARYDQMQTIIADAKRKYKSGITVQQARNILREANQRFGASVLDDSGDAVARAAQKVEANVLRDALKSRFPTIKQSLDDESELIQLRELLKKGRAVNKSKKPNFGRLDLTRPGTFADVALSSPRVTRGLSTIGGSPSGSVNPLLMGAQAGVKANLGEAILNPSQSENSSINPNTMATNMNIPTAVQNIPELSQVDANMSMEGTTPSPFNPDSIHSSVQKIMQNGGTVKDALEFVSLAEAINKITFGASDKKSLTASQATRAAAANNALRDIPMIAESIESGKLGGAKVLPGSGTQIGRRLLGTENLDAALFNIADNILRARTGAAAPEAEVRRFVETFLPSATDSAQAKRDKLARAVRELQGYVNPMEASADTLEEALMTQGAF